MTYMTVRDFFESVLKHVRLIAFLTALAIIACSAALYMTQKSTARVIIKYIGADAKDGYAENGEEIRPYEINSSAVIQKAVQQLGYDGVDTERLRRNITVSPLIPTSEEEKYDSWIENFADYENTEENMESPVYYEVTYTSAYGRDFAKNILNAVIKQYRIFYAENYTYISDITDLGGEIVQQYDYYETIELLNDKIESNITYLDNISSGDLNYRSIETGYSIDDLKDGYNNIKNHELAVAERSVLDSGASKNSSLLIDSLRNKISGAEQDSSLASQKAETNKGLMEVYSVKNEEYIWDDQNDSDRDQDDSVDYDGQVRGDVERDHVYEQNKSTYDQLMLDYVEFRTESENLLIDKTVYESAVKSFSSPTANSETNAEIESTLTTACDKYNELYALTETVIDDYNAFKSSRSIETESDVTVEDTQNDVFYYGVSVIVAIGLGIVLSIAIELILFRKKAEAKDEADDDYTEDENQDDDAYEEAVNEELTEDETVKEEEVEAGEAL